MVESEWLFWTAEHIIFYPNQIKAEDSIIFFWEVFFTKSLTLIMQRPPQQVFWLGEKNFGEEGFGRVEPFHGQFHKNNIFSVNSSLTYMRIISICFTKSHLMIIKCKLSTYFSIKFLDLFHSSALPALTYPLIQPGTPTPSASSIQTTSKMKTTSKIKTNSKMKTNS